MASCTLPTRRRAILVCAFVALTAGMCAALLGAAALVPAPPMILPFLVVICIGCPMVAACELPGAVAELRATRRPRSPLDPRELETLRRQLDALPETQHPLGL
jgi:hypothetical protein